MGALLGTIGALCIGMSDLFGRRIMLESSALTAAVVMQVGGGLVSLAVVAVVSSEWVAGDLARGLASGIGMGIGLSCYYAGLARSTSTVVAPLVATLSAVLPFGYVVVAVDGGSTPGVLAAGVALVGLLLVSAGADAVSNVGAGLFWGTLSGLGYGVGIAVLAEVSERSGAWPAVSQRLAAFVLLAVVGAAVGVPLTPPQGTRTNAVLAGFFVAATTIALLLGVRLDPGPAVLALSTFPAFSVLIGRAFFGDPVRAIQAAGIVVVLIGLAGVAAA